MSEKPKHSKIGASSMHRWAKCPGSVRLSEGMPNVAGVAAKEGTAAHEVVGLALERAFSENKNPKLILDDALEAMHLYAEYIWSLKGPKTVAHVEHSFDMSETFENLYGTADCVLYEPDQKLLRVIDYKHGKNLVVQAKNNLQLSYYALGAINTLNHPCTHVQMTIVQPRAYHPEGPIRSWIVPSLYFLEFEDELITAAQRTQNPDAPLHAGAHCTFCPARPKCPLKHEKKLAQAQKDFAPPEKDFSKSEFGFFTDPKNDFEPIKDERNLGFDL